LPFFAGKQAAIDSLEGSIKYRLSLQAIEADMALTVVVEAESLSIE